MKKISEFAKEAKYNAFENEQVRDATAMFSYFNKHKRETQNDEEGRVH